MQSNQLIPNLTLSTPIPTALKSPSHPLTNLFKSPLTLHFKIPLKRTTNQFPIDSRRISNLIEDQFVVEEGGRENVEIRYGRVEWSVERAEEGVGIGRMGGGGFVEGVRE